ncbi:hypothetical protein P154DRAFT_580477 [Amniculicola lignicola CBS 123094]|uniref:Uncharacterized protein n=1 Tax=Amniculicola lignicola CBS 123094 TaxID=1392246 RepID=A0A6A5W3J3_9PLEO|nr:hypothetical protein P154DRAFT_580477 [Amniculicola lignicola CBS 123094]
MAALDAELSGELSRILACPYPTSLAKLADILTRADGWVVRKCIQDRPPCAVSKLASIIIDALPLWAYSLHVLEALCHSSDFKDEVLLQNSGILNALLTKANSSQRGFDECAQICVLLLSRPLPKSVPLPASAQTFFLQAFEWATKAPDITTLRPIYHMLNGACRELLSLLSSEDRQIFDQKLCHILSSNSTTQNPMLPLWCFGIVILLERPHEVGMIRSLGSSSYKESDQVISDNTWKTSSGRKLFGSASGLQKTINVTVLNVIWASKGGVGVSDLDALEVIRIAIRTMHFVDPKLRQAWSTGSTLAKGTFHKLPGKILRADISARVQLEAMCFYAMIAGQNQLLDEVVTKYEHALCDIGHLQVELEFLRESLSVSLPLFAPQLRGPFTQEILTRILGCNSTSSPSQATSNFSVLVEQMSAIIPESTRLRDHILSTLSSEPQQRSIVAFLELPPRIQSKEGGCDTYTSFTSRRLFSSTVAMLLMSALSSSNAELRPSPALVLALVSYQQILALGNSSRCSHAPLANTRPAISLFQEECTPSTGAQQQNWQDRIKSQLTTQSAYQHDSIVRSMAQICQDLENRCENVEEPLRLEQRKVSELTARVTQLGEHIESLESEGIERRLYIDGLEVDVNNLENEKENVSARLEEVQNDFAEAKQQATETLNAAQEAFTATEGQLRSTIVTQEETLATRTEELNDLNLEMKRAHEQFAVTEKQLQSTITAHEESISAQERSMGQLNDQLKSQQSQLQGKKEKLDEQREVHQSLNEAYEVVKGSLRSREQNLEDERCTVAQQVHELEHLRASNISLQSHLSSTELDLQAATGQLSDLKERHEDLTQSSAEALRDLEHRYTADLDTAKAKLDSLTLKAEQLTDALSLKDQHLSDLKKWKKGVLSYIRCPADSPFPDRTHGQTKEDFGIPRTPRDRRRKSSVQAQGRNEAPMDNVVTRGITSTAMEDIANASFASSNSRGDDGSTPKRAKTCATRASFKSSAIPTSFNDRKPTLARLEAMGRAKPLTPTKRSALRTLSPNRRHTTVGFALSEADESEETGKGTRRTSTHMVENAAFDMDAHLASTPFTPGDVVFGTGRGPEEEFGGESETIEL